MEVGVQEVDNDTRGWIMCLASALGMSLRHCFKMRVAFRVLYFSRARDPRGSLTIVPLACAFGSSFVCVDLVARFLPFRAQFRVSQSPTFQACSLSLSFGVMVSSCRLPCIMRPGLRLECPELPPEYSSLYAPHVILTAPVFRDRYVHRCIACYHRRRPTSLKPDTTKVPHH